MTVSSHPCGEGPSAPQRAPSDDLAKFRRGELTEEEYLQARIDVATAHLQGKVSPERLEMVREVVTLMLDSDPVLVEMKERLLRGKRG